MALYCSTLKCNDNYPHYENISSLLQCLLQKRIKGEYIWDAAHRSRGWSLRKQKYVYGLERWWRDVPPLTESHCKLRSLRKGLIQHHSPMVLPGNSTRWVPVVPVCLIQLWSRIDPLNGFCVGACLPGTPSHGVSGFGSFEVTKWKVC